MHDRGFITSFVLKMAIPVAIFAIAVLEVGSAVISRTQALDVASQAATEANIHYFNSRSIKDAEEGARAYIAQNGMTFESLTIDPETQTVTVGVGKQAPSLIMKRIDATKKFTDIHVTQSVPFKK